MTNTEGGKIINAEFGEQPRGRGIMRMADWWPSMLKRITELCENAYDKGKQDCLAPDHTIVTNDTISDYDSARRVLIDSGRASRIKEVNLTGAIEDLLKEIAVNKLPDLEGEPITGEKSGATVKIYNADTKEEIPINGQCAHTEICKFRK